MHRQLTTAALVLACAVSAPARGATDQDIYTLIDATRPIAEAVVIDGQGADWAGIPTFSGPTGDAGGDDSRDITGVSIAPLEDALLVRIETAGSPASLGVDFWIHVDFLGQQWLDLEIGLYPGWPDILWIYEEGQAATFQYWDDSVLAIGDVVEARIPYALLDPLLPPSMQGKLGGSSARSWVRVLPYTVDGSVVDWGAAAASYRLAAAPYPLDPDLPPGGEDSVVLPPPLDGKWYVGQGAFGLGTHAGYWGYDLSIVDGALHPDDPYESSDNEDYFSFGQPIRAPLAGTVYSLDDSQPDLQPRTFVPPPTPPNFVYFDIGGGIALLFSHLKQGTIPLAPGQAVAAGALMGSVGHSGSASWSHLHLGGEEIGVGSPGVPLALTGVEVSLNHAASDPWARDLGSWGIHEGFFVAPAGTVGCDLHATPGTGTVPFGTAMRATLFNLYTGQTRRISARIDLRTGSGSFFSNWRSGFTNVGAGGTYPTTWNQNIPARGAVLGENVFTLRARDVTPSPFNQPPYPPAGDSVSDAATVVANAP